MLFAKVLRTLLLILACASIALAQTPAATPQAAKTAAAMTNDDVIALVEAGLDEAIVIAKIGAAKSTAFDTSIAGLKSLKAAGVSIEVVKTMISPPQQREAAVLQALPDPEDFNQVQPTGVYALVRQGGGPGHMTKLAYTQPSRITPAPNLFSHVKATLDGQKAAIEFSDVNPVFFIYPKTDDATVQREINSFQLIKFAVSKKARELTLGSYSKRPSTPSRWWRSRPSKCGPVFTKLQSPSPSSPGSMRFMKAERGGPWWVPLTVALTLSLAWLAGSSERIWHRGVPVSGLRVPNISFSHAPLHRDTFAQGGGSSDKM